MGKTLFAWTYIVGMTGTVNQRIQVTWAIQLADQLASKEESLVVGCAFDDLLIGQRDGERLAKIGGDPR